MVELIPKKEQKPVFGQVFFLIISVAMLCAVALAFFVFKQLARDAREVLEVLEQRFSQDTRPLEEELTAQLQGYKRKTEMLRTVLDERKNVLAFFELLEQTSHPGVVFGEFTGDAKTGTFTLMGEAQNFFVLEQQRLVWKEQKEFRYMLNDIQLGEGGKSGFEVEFVVEPKILDSI
ncbi:MAG TPA: hypothetical protein VJC15_00950 [Candidatus Paceibacterota bacterium]